MNARARIMSPFAMMPVLAPVKPWQVVCHSWLPHFVRHKELQPNQAGFSYKNFIYYARHMRSILAGQHEHEMIALSDQPQRDVCEREIGVVDLLLHHGRI